VEGRDLFSGKVDVIVCDGFVGNICLKLSEGLAEALGQMLKQEILKAGMVSKLGFQLLKPAFKCFSKRVDYAEEGGVPLLGVNGVVVISHGASGPKAIMNAVRVALQAVQNRIIDQVLDSLNRHEPFYRKTKPQRFWGSFRKKTG